MKKQLLQTFNRVAESAVGGEKCANTPPVWAKGASYRVIAVIFMFCMLGIGSMWATDVSVEERFAGVSQDKSSGRTGTTWTGDICNWFAVYARRKSTGDLINSKQATWLSMDTDADPRGYIKTTNLEGGIKYVEFPYAQFDTETDNFLKLEVRAIASSDGVTILKQKEETRGEEEDEGINKATGETYTWDCACKANAQLQIINTSVKRDGGGTPTSENMPRWLVGNVTITPYLRYQQKSVTIGLPNKGYINRNLINNTDGLGSITYSIHDKNAETTLVADVDELTGAITPKAAGTAVVTATWEGVTTTYELTVDPNIYVESFSKNASYEESPSAEGSWDSDVSDIIPSWKVYLTMRTEPDTIGGTYVHGTYLRTKTDAQGYLKTSGAVEGGVKALSFDWKQGRVATGCTLNLATYLGETKVQEDSKPGTAAAPPGTEIWNYNYDGTISVQANSVLEIRNTSTVGSREPRLILSALKITPYLLYYDKSVEWDRTVDANASITNTALIDNTEGTVTYSISENEIEAAVDEDGVVTATGGGTVTVTASWEQVTTSYNLHIKANTTASFTNPVVNKNITEIAFTIAVNKTPNMAVANYTSSNENVAIVDENGTVTVKGVGQTTITATIAEDENYGGSSASYILRVTDNSTTNAVVEAFSAVPNGNAAAHAGQPWNGDVYGWRVSSCGGVRKNGDKFASDQEREGIWMGTPDPNTNYSSLTVENGVEGGIKHIWFYCEQPYNTGETNYTLKPVVYLDEAIEANKVADIEIVGTSGEESIAANRTLFGASNVTKANSVLIIRNESYKTSDGSRPTIDPGRGRFLLDEIHITPWLLYTDKSKQTLRVDETYTREPDIDNTAGEAGALTYISSDPTVATVIASGENAGQVTGVGRGTATITAKFQWNNSDDFVETTYKVEVFPVNCETFSVTSTDNYYTKNSNIQEDVAKWSTYYGGINSNENFEPNVAFIRAPRDGEKEDGKKSYIQSSPIEGGIASMSFDWNIVGGETNINWDIRVFVNGRLVKTLTNAEEGDALYGITTRQPNMTECNIALINEPDNFTIRFENHSTFTDTYGESENRARFVIDNVTWTSYDGSVKSLDDTKDNSGWLTANAGETRDVNTTRVLVANAWNTLCMPFEISVSDLGENAEVQDLFGVEQDGDDLIFGFKPLVGEVLEAGHPYLVKPAGDDNVTLTGFEGKTIVAEPMTLTRGDYALVGVFSPLTLTNDGKTLFVGPDNGGNNLYYPNSTNGNLMNGFRAYFKKVSGPAQAPKRVRYVVNYHNTATDVESIQCSDVRVQKVLRDGHLYILRDGRMYNAQGLLIKE